MKENKGINNEVIEIEKPLLSLNKADKLLLCLENESERIEEQLCFNPKSLFDDWINNLFQSLYNLQY